MENVAQWLLARRDWLKERTKGWSVLHWLIDEIFSRIVWGFALVLWGILKSLQVNFWSTLSIIIGSMMMASGILRFVVQRRVSAPTAVGPTYLPKTRCQELIEVGERLLAAGTESVETRYWLGDAKSFPAMDGDSVWWPEFASLVEELIRNQIDGNHALRTGIGILKNYEATESQRVAKQRSKLRA